MKKFFWCQSNDISFPISTHRIWDTCHLISYKIPIPKIILSYEPKEALTFSITGNRANEVVLAQERTQGSEEKNPSQEQKEEQQQF